MLDEQTVDCIKAARIEQSRAIGNGSLLSVSQTTSLMGSKDLMCCVGLIFDGSARLTSPWPSRCLECIKQSSSCYVRQDLSSPANNKDSGSDCDSYLRVGNKSSAQQTPSCPPGNVSVFSALYFKCDNDSVGSRRQALSSVLPSGSRRDKCFTTSPHSVSASSFVRTVSMISEAGGRFSENSICGSS